MTNLREQVGEVRSIVYSEVQDADISISSQEIEVSIPKTDTTIRGSTDERLDEIRAGIKQSIHDALGYDISVAVMVEAERK
jgi:hypothetical protein